MNQIRHHLQGADAVIDRCQNPKRSQSRTSQTGAEQTQQQLSTPGNQGTMRLIYYAPIPGSTAAATSAFSTTHKCCCRSLLLSRMLPAGSQLQLPCAQTSLSQVAHCAHIINNVFSLSEHRQTPLYKRLMYNSTAISLLCPCL
jgi:hypothetical protein